MPPGRKALSIDDLSPEAVRCLNLAGLIQRRLERTRARERREAGILRDAIVQAKEHGAVDRQVMDATGLSKTRVREILRQAKNDGQ